MTAIDINRQRADKTKSHLLKRAAAARDKIQKAIDGIYSIDDIDFNLRVHLANAVRKYYETDIKMSQDAIDLIDTIFEASPLDIK